MKKLLIEIPEEKEKQLINLLKDWNIKIAEIDGVYLSIKPIENGAKRNRK